QYTPAEASKNLEDTLTGLAYSTPGVANAMSIRDAYEAKERAGKAEPGSRERQQAEAESAMSALSAFLPFSLGKLSLGGVSRFGVFAGPAAKTADLDALARAKEMAKAGASRDEIWDATGWRWSNEGKWKFEIDDSATRLTPRAAEKLAKTDEGLAAYEGNISGGFEHPELYAAYADSAPFWSDYTLRKGPGGGAYYEDVDKYVAHGRRPEQARSMTLHELQHGVQTREGFAPGGHPESVKDLPGTRALADKYYEDMKDIVLLPEPQVRAMAEGRAAEEVYKRLAGEVEARNVQTRRNMTAAERRATPPWKTQDIPDEQQIITRVRPTRQEVFVPVKEEARIKKAQQLFDEYADEIGPDEANKRIHAETDDWFGPEGTLLYEIRDNPGMEIKGTF